MSQQPAARLAPVAVGELPPRPPFDIRFVIPGQPRGKAAGKIGLMHWTDKVTGEPRSRGMLFGDKKTRSEESAVRLFASVAMNVAGETAPASGPIEMILHCHMSIPPSWPKVRQENARAGIVWPTGKPDLDNIAKLFLDGCKTVVFMDDCQIVLVYMQKIYSDTPRIVARFKKVPPNAKA